MQSKTITICGVGGIGSLSAEMLARCGIGKLILIDLDVVEAENLNRVMFKPEHIGRKKAEVCTEILHEINPDIQVEFLAIDIMNLQFESAFELILDYSDLILNGLDNIPARQYLNIKCIKTNRPYIDAGALRSGFGGYVHLVIPKVTACYQCTASVQLNVSANNARGPKCTASLPSTLAIISSLQVQQALKFLLNFGKIPDFISYNGITDDFTTVKLQRDEYCYACGSNSEPDTKLDKINVSQSNVSSLIKELERTEKKLHYASKKKSMKRRTTKKS